MCLAIPAQVLAIDAATATATVTLGGVRRAISLALVDDLAVGDYVLVHVGYALNKISVAEAEETLALIAAAGALADADDPPHWTSQPPAHQPPATVTGDPAP